MQISVRQSFNLTAGLQGKYDTQTLRTYEAKKKPSHLPEGGFTFPMPNSGVGPLERWEARRESRMGPARRCGKEIC